jgi:hypothetical protein
MKKIAGILITIIILFQSCKNDLEVNAPWVETPVVYALLDVNKSTQYIRISKTFQASEAQTPPQIAKNKDSLYFSNIVVTIKNLRTQEVFNFTKTKDLDKSPGYFTNDSGGLYSDGGSMKLNQNSSVYYDVFELSIYSPSTQKTYKATTRLLSPGYDISAINNNIMYAGTYLGTTPKFLVPKPRARTISGGSIYDLGYRVYYDEYPVGNPAAKKTKSVDFYFIRNNTLSGLSIGEEISTSDVKTKWIDFFSYLSVNIPNDASVQRRFLHVRAICNVGSADMLDYYNLTKPSTSISQKNPLYTNITDCIGIFSSVCQIESSPLPQGLAPGPGVLSPDSTALLISKAANFVYP